MPLKFEKVHGRPTQMFLRHLGSAVSPPAPLTITVSGPGAAQGALSIPVSSLGAAVPKNTILTFSRAGGPPDEVQVVVTTDADQAATALAVEAYDGAPGEGIQASLASADAAVWDGLYTDIASQSLDFGKNSQTQDLNPVTHGSGTGVTLSLPEVTSIAPAVTRQGLFFAHSPVIRDLLTYGDSNANWWGKLVVPDEFGAPFVTYQGLGVVSGVGHPAPSDNIVQLNYTFRFKQFVTPTFPTEGS